MQNYTSVIIAMLIWTTIIVGSIAAWFTHIIYCFAEGAWGFLIAGAIFFPVAMAHGVWIWFGGGA